MLNFPNHDGRSTLGIHPKCEYLIAVRNQLLDALYKGWEDFKNSPDYSRYVDIFARLGRAGFYEEGLREWLPNPAYDNAAREICGLFRARAGELGLCLVKDTPGDWQTSTEVISEDGEARAFLMPVFKDGAPLGTLRLVFFHRHDRFDFPKPPILEVVDEGITR